MIAKEKVKLVGKVLGDLALVKRWKWKDEYDHDILYKMMFFKNEFKRTKYFILINKSKMEH